jgi:hypothetical protein
VAWRPALGWRLSLLNTRCGRRRGQSPTLAGDWWIEGRKVGPVCMDRKRNMPGPVVERNWSLDGLVRMLGHNANNSLAKLLVNGVERPRS